MKKKVLVVDDEKSFTNLLHLNLEQTGNYDVQRGELERGRTGHRARAFKPDIMLLDIIMPRMPGGNVVAQFEADAEMKDLPIVFFTAAVQRSRLEEMDGIISGRPCLSKPASLEEIVAMIEKLTSGSAPA